MITAISSFNSNTIAFKAAHGKLAEKLAKGAGELGEKVADSFQKNVPKGLTSKLPIRFDDCGSTSPPDNIDPSLQSLSGTSLFGASILASSC